jgi:hypothetical protein
LFSIEGSLSSLWEVVERNEILVEGEKKSATTCKLTDSRPIEAIGAWQS